MRKVDIDEQTALQTLIDFARDAHSDNWYFEANKWAQDVAQRLGYTLEQVVGVTALLSPLTEWELNKRRTERVLIAWQSGEKISVTFKKTMENVYKCLNNEPFKFGPKTGSFYQNILHPEIDNPATIDSLATSIVLGIPQVTGTYNVNPNTLELIQNIYAKAAKHYGVTTQELQASTWVKCNAMRKGNKGFGATLHSRFVNATSDASQNDSKDLSLSEVLALIAE